MGLGRREGAAREARVGAEVRLGFGPARPMPGSPPVSTARCSSTAERFSYGWAAAAASARPQESLPPQAVLVPQRPRAVPIPRAAQENAPTACRWCVGVSHRWACGLAARPRARAPRRRRRASPSARLDARGLFRPRERALAATLLHLHETSGATPLSPAAVKSSFCAAFFNCPRVPPGDIPRTAARSCCVVSWRGGRSARRQAAVLSRASVGSACRRRRRRCRR